MSNSKVLASLAYILWIPSLYIVLTEKRKEEFVGFHGAQALLLWTGIFIFYFFLRFLVNLIWNLVYFPFLNQMETAAALMLYGYAFYCGIRSFRGELFNLPH